jgi:hypothetical protein
MKGYEERALEEKLLGKKVWLTDSQDKKYFGEIIDVDYPYSIGIKGIKNFYFTFAGPHQGVSKITEINSNNILMENPLVKKYYRNCHDLDYEEMKKVRDFIMVYKENL